jgi:hypothetical protein
LALRRPLRSQDAGGGAEALVDRHLVIARSESAGEGTAPRAALLVDRVLDVGAQLSISDGAPAPSTPLGALAAGAAEASGRRAVLLDVAKLLGGARGRMLARTRAVPRVDPVPGAGAA